MGQQQGRLKSGGTPQSFLDPFVTLRETSSNMGLGVEVDRSAEDQVRTRVQRQQQGQRVT